jgi:hypothetical protein
VRTAPRKWPGPEFDLEAERRAAQFLREQGLQVEPGRARLVFLTSDGFELTAEDRVVPLPEVEELLRLLV